jgi:signal transduction histidine kinase/CheY-like chemotaxis protein
MNHGPPSEGAAPLGGHAGRSRWFARAGVPLSALLLTLLLAVTPGAARVQRGIDDMLLGLAAAPLAAPSVLVVDLDEDSIRRLKPAFGAWPFRRDAYALVIDYLREAGARAVVIGVVLADERDGDAALQRSLNAPGAPVVLAAAAWRSPPQTDGAARTTAMAVPAGPAAAIDAPAQQWPDWLLPAASLQAQHVGLVTLPIDDDGRLRRLPVLHAVDGRQMPSLPVAVVQALQCEGSALRFDADEQVFGCGPLQWPVDAQGRVRLPPMPRAEALSRLSFHALAGVAAGAVPDRALSATVAGRDVFIGSSAGLDARVMTPDGQRAATDWLAGAYVALAQQHVLRMAPAWVLPVLLALAMLPSLTTMWRGRAAPWRDTAAAAAAALLLLGAALVSLRSAQQQLPVTWPLLAVAAGWLLALVAHQRQLRAANQRLALERAVADAANAAKSEFLASMSHELRTPLNGMIGASQLLRDQGDDPARRQELLDMIRSSGGHLLGLIDGVLNLARIEAGVLELSREPFNLADVVEAVLATTAVPARGKGLQIAAVLDPELPAWRIGDPMRLRQVLLNLVGNAVKFTPRGEVVMRVTAGTARDELVMRIRDTGIGLGPEAQARIFEPFRQADTGTMRRFGGTGLGLTICRRLVQAMAGSIEVESAPDQGACFTVRLTLPPAPEQPAAPAVGGRVVFIEPHEASAESLQALLQRMGCEPVRCADAVALHDALSWRGPDGQPPWLLAATDDDAALDVLEAASEWVDGERVIGMTHLPWYAADSARERVRLPRSVLKPVLRSALVSRFGASARLSPGVTAAAPLHSDARGGRVLIVEDDPVNQAIVTAMLSQAGFQTQVAADGSSALQFVARQRFDLLLMDWQMPDLDGPEVTRRLRAGEAGEHGRRVPVVALTANAFAEDRVACLAAGMNDFLSKPVVADDLVAMVSRWVQPAP